MKVNQIIQETTSGSVATVAMPLGEIQKRPDVKGLKPVDNAMSGKNKKKGPYANSLLEGKVKELQMDLSSGRDGLNDADFKKKYGKTKQEMRKSLQDKPKSDKPVYEAKLDEDDLILIPGHGGKRKTGFVPHGQSRVDHEVEMARSDVLATMKNAKAIYQLLQNRSEDEGLEGWVQEKLIKANDYLNAVKEYYDEKSVGEMTGGVIAGGGVGEGVAEASNIGGYPFNPEDPKNWAKKRAYDNRMASKADREANKPAPLAKTPKIATPKLTYDMVWRKVEDVVGRIYPDGDPIDWLLPWFERQGIKGLDIGDILRKAAKKNGYKDIYDYWDSFSDDLGYNESVAEGSKNKLEFDSLSKAREYFSNLAHERGTSPIQMYGNGDAAKYTEFLKKHVKQQGVAEGAKVDRMVKHIAQSEKKLGHSKKEAENIAWATANKRGMLDNKNKKGK